MSANGVTERGEKPARVGPVALSDQLLWLGLSAMGSVMLLAVTNHITQNISSVPFLWVQRLALWGCVAVAMAATVFVVHGMYGYAQGMRVMERDFYGVVRTADHPDPVPYRSMYHGGIMHGGQLLGDSFRNTPADYFGPTSGYGRVFTSMHEIAPRRNLSVGVIGLGAGVIAAWMRPGDRLVFYEISPRVVDIARREFTFLSDTSAKTEVILGDGRLSLEREPPP